ncbi:hypothetical protein [Mycobacterium tuberculosis]|uniref:hypothetical protein n=1 Tax=Mycobacterium tuberculosis TaxID=1773 RepID=UPI003D7C1EED
MRHTDGGTATPAVAAGMPGMPFGTMGGPRLRACRAPVWLPPQLRRTTARRRVIP